MLHISNEDLSSQYMSVIEVITEFLVLTVFSSAQNESIQTVCITAQSFLGTCYHFIIYVTPCDTKKSKTHF